jgi:hypothetical protein
MKTALPIFGLFMQKSFADKSCSLKPTPFPKEPFPIDVPHNCRMRAPRIDTAVVEVDSLGAENVIPDTIPQITQ